ncbi:MAG: AI-2E family transporter, partial [Lewinella sp.]
MPLENNMIIRKVKRNIFFILVAITTLAFFWLIGPFLLTVFWGAVLAVIFFPVYRRIRLWFRGKDSLAGAITTLLVVLFVIIPFTLLAIALVNQAMSLYQSVQAGDINPSVVLDYVDERLPQVSEALGDFGVSTEDLRTRLNTSIGQASQFLAGWAIGFGGSILNIIIQFTLVIYLLYFFLVDGWKIQRTLVDTIPMGDHRERALFDRFALVARATLKGTLIVAFVQGAIG